MKAVELYARVRRACHVEGMSQRQAAREFGIDPKTVAKMLRFSVPPGYRRSKPPARPKLDPDPPPNEWTPLIRSWERGRCRMTKARREFTAEFKREAVALLESSGRPQMQIA